MLQETVGPQNGRQRIPQGAALLAAAGCAVLSLVVTLPSEVLRLGQSPPGSVDGRDYDHLALSLARGRGFSNCWSDPEWRAPYRHAENRERYALHLSLQGACFPTARRAPGYPAALAAVYWSWGRSFMAGRLLSAVALALAGAIGAFLCVRVGGMLAGTLFTLGFLLDSQLRIFVGAYWSEPLAALAVIAVLAAHVALLRNPRPLTAILAGASLGILLLVRHHFSLLYALGILGSGFAAVFLRARLVLCLAHAGAALVAFAPWGVRNCLVLHALAPLGTQGGHSLAASYALDEVTADGGWDADRIARLWAMRQGKPAGYKDADLAFDVRSSLAVEQELSMAGQEAARRWLRRNWRQVPKVVLIRLRAHARGYGWLALTASALGLAAFALPETRQVAALCLLVLALTAATVSMTFEAGRGRYSAPVRPVAYVIGALGLAGASSRLLPRIPLLANDPR